MTQLMNKCRHPAACYECLRTHYVHYAMTDPENFPLKCFWPGCDRTVRDVQMRRLTRSAREMRTYYQNEMQVRIRRKEQERMAGMARQRRHENLLASIAEQKEQRQEEENRRQAEEQRKRLQKIRLRNFTVAQPCPECAASNAVCVGCLDAQVCFNCKNRFAVNHMPKDEIVSIVEALGDVLVNCPACGILIAKDGGCDLVTCTCAELFDFSEEKKRFDSEKKPSAYWRPRKRDWSSGTPRWVFH